MARKRMLSPEMFTSRTVSGWPVQTRWTWAGMLCYLDNYGYGDDSAALVKAAVWPRDDAYAIRKVQADLDRIVKAGTLCRFTCCGAALLHCPKWSDWQTVAYPGKFRFCPCPIHDRPAHEAHLRLSRDLHEGFNPNVVQENLDQSSSSDGSADHDQADCPAPPFCKFHRNKQATA